MSDNTSSEKYDVPFFYEKNLRMFLSRFYHSIVQSGENAREILNVDLDDFFPKNIAGDKDTKNSMEDVFRKLECVRIFFKNDKLFESQIIEPLRIASDLRKQFTDFKGGKRSTNMEGLIFARSIPHGESLTNDVTLSIICPDLQSIMSLRVSNNAISKNNGWFEIEKVQPIVLVNRLHPIPGSKTKINPLKKEKNLFEFNFLFSSVGDLNSFSKSLEMELFSEMSSIQSDKQRHLGYTFVSFGEVTHFDEQDITIKSMLTEDEFELTIASRNFRNNSLNRISEDVVGKTVVFLGIIWYGIRAKDDIKMDCPELLDIQLCDDLSLLVLSEIMGYIRLRRTCSVNDLKKHLCTDHNKFEEIFTHLEKSPLITITRYKDGLNLLYKTKLVADPIKSAYVKSLDEIKRLREIVKTEGKIQVTQEDIVDKNKINSEGMIRQMYYDCKSHEKIRCMVRLNILKSLGDENELKEGIDASNLLEMFIDKNHPLETIRGQLWFLKNIVGLIERKNKNCVLTNSGKKILEKIREKESITFLQTSGNIVELLTVPESVHVPTLLKCLEDPKNQFLPFKKGTIRTKIFWTRINSSPEEIVSERVDGYRKICNEIFSLMLTKRYPINSEKILEELFKRGIRIKIPVLEILLGDIVEGTGRIRKLGGFYEYIFEARITEFLKGNKKQYFTVLEIMENTCIQKLNNNMPEPHNEVTVRNILLALERLEVVVNYYDGVERWTSSENPKVIEMKKNPLQHLNEELKNTIRHQVLSILNQSRSMNRNDLEETIAAIVSDLDFSISENKLTNKISEMISEMIGKEELFSDGYTISLSSSW